MSYVRTYNPGVRVGNWNEDLNLEEDVLKDFLERKEKGQLLIQKSSNLMDTVLQKTELSISNQGVVRFGDTVMVINPGAKDNSRGSTALCVNMTDSSQGFTGPCGVSATGKTDANARTTFVITSMDGSRNGEPLNYGQPFYLVTANGGLKLYSDRASFHNSAKKSRHNAVVLVNEESHLTEWKAEPFDPLYRMELEWSPVRANTPLIIKHVKTNQNLNIEVDCTLKTPFGRESEVTSHTNLDSHKAEKDSNHWMIVMSVPGDRVMSVEAPPAPQSTAPVCEVSAGTEQCQTTTEQPTQ